jgi:hypothetical protein
MNPSPREVDDLHGCVGADPFARRRVPGVRQTVHEAAGV